MMAMTTWPKLTPRWLPGWNAAKRPLMMVRMLTMATMIRETLLPRNSPRATASSMMPKTMMRMPATSAPVDCWSAAPVPDAAIKSAITPEIDVQNTGDDDENADERHAARALDR